MRGEYKAHLDSELQKVNASDGRFTPVYPSLLEGQWKGMVWPQTADADHDPVTGVEKDVLEKVGKASIKTPDDFVSGFFDHEWVYVVEEC